MGAARAAREPHTARALLEENRQLIAEKRERRALQRKTSREEFDKLVVHDQMSIAGEKAREQDRRHAHRELAEQYKEEISGHKQTKCSAYEAKRVGGSEIQYFPFVEGETIDQDRKAK